MPRPIFSLVFLLSACSVAGPVPTATSPDPASPAQDSVVRQVFRASDWIGAVTSGDQGCNASMGEYTLWVYALGSQCGVSPDRADRVAIIRQPLPGVAPIRALTQLPAGRYAAWAYGAGDAGTLQIRLCARGCIIGNLPREPAWMFLGWLELRDRQTIYLRSWQQPETTLLSVQQLVLSSSEAEPDWIP
jgi:hypothetical protein